MRGMPKPPERLLGLPLDTCRLYCARLLLQQSSSAPILLRAIGWRVLALTNNHGPTGPVIWRVTMTTTKTPRPGTAAAIAAQIRSNMRAWNARAIDYQEFTRLQRAAWNPVVGRNRLHDLVLAILNRADKE
jgi:hypothetical protein